MTTVTYPCGCTFTRGMLGPRHLLSFHLCTCHSMHSKILDTKVVDLQDMVLKLLEDVGLVPKCDKD